MPRVLVANFFYLAIKKRVGESNKGSFLNVLKQIAIFRKKKLEVASSK
jgi:hypothetical protein